MATTSRFAQLTDYCLVEYRYADPLAPEDYSYTFRRIVNSAVDGQVQLMNRVDAADAVTRNVRERSAVQISNGVYADTDKDQLPNYLDYNADLAWTEITAPNCPYDTVVIHLLAGYNFEGIDGTMFKVTADERSGKEIVLCNVVFLKTADWFEYNPDPVLLGDKLYDRYIQVKIPSAKLNNDIYYSLEGNPTQSQTFIAKSTSNNMGLLRANPLKVSAIEIASTTVESVGGANYNLYSISSTKTVALNQSDEFALLGATIQESPGGDYYEYFATWGGGFIEDYIGATSGLPGYDYIVIHELTVREQIGSIFTKTAFFQSIQEENFDQPNLFRPIVLNGSAVSFTIEYVMRLYNKANSEQVIRTGSVSSYNASRWGRDLTRISLLSEPESNKVYNKVVAGPTLPETTFLNNSLPVTVTGDQEAPPTKVIPAFFERTTITAQSDTIHLDGEGQIAQQASGDTQPVYGQGDATIAISPFDNYFKFTILKTDVSRGNAPSPVDLGQNAAYYLVFIDNDGNKQRYLSVADEKLGDPQSGDLIFKVPGTDAVNILQFDDKQFWITSRFDETDAETSIYHGEFVAADELERMRERQRVAEERSKVKAAFDARIAELEKKLETTQAALDEATAANVAATRPTAISAKGEGQSVTKEGKKIPSGLKEETVEQLTVAVPGLNKAVPKTKKTSVVANIAPKVVPKTFKKKSK